MKATPLLLFCFTLIHLSLFASPYTVKSVPNTKILNNSYVSNPDNILSNNTVAEINNIVSNIEKQKGAEVAVVIVDEIDDRETPKSFATSLFNFWGIGNKETDNGLLILLVKSEKRIEFETGYGIEGVLPDITCFRIQQDIMLPHFRTGNYDQGMIAGIKAISNTLIQSDLIVPTIQPPSTIETVLGPHWKTIISIYFILSTAFLTFFIIKKSKLKTIGSPDFSGD